jgi:V-type H+-transporting ATPase subunit a
MVMGLVIKGLNSIYFNKMLDFKHEVIPQLLLLICMFGYMDLLILIKWNTDWVEMGE